MEPVLKIQPPLLEAFLDSLTPVGIRPTVRDYERIRLALAGQSAWSREQLCSMLGSLLATTPQQLKAFEREFDSFFDRDLEVPELLEALGRLRREKLEKKRAPGPVPVPPVLPPPGPARWRRLLLAVITLTLLGALGWVAIDYFTPEPPVVHTGLISGRVVDTNGAALVGVPVSAIGPDASKTVHSNAEGEFFFLDLADGTYRVETESQTEGLIRPVVTLVELRADLRERTGLLLTLDPVEPPEQEDEAVDKPAVRRFEDIVMVGDLVPIATRPPLELGAAVLLALATGAWAVFLYGGARPAPAIAPQVDPAHPDRFDASRIGGRPARWLSQQDLDHFADSLGYSESETPSRFLDFPRTVDATSRNAGLASLVFHPRRTVRIPVILEDVYADSRPWNPLARELAAGLRARRVPLIHGQFHRSPQEFFTLDARRRRLDELAEDASHHLVLLFTDGKRLRPRDRAGLETIADWPMVAWMDLREPRFWDATALLPVEHEIPIFPASPQGLVEVFDYHFAAGSSTTDYAEAARRGWRRPAAGAGLGWQVEELLGDSVAWAQSCAMIQPVSLGLAHALRLRFHPHLPVERTGRLFALPGSRHTPAGLSFSRHVVSVLRSGFGSQPAAERQREILDFLLEQIANHQPDATPGEPANLAQLGWRRTYERVRLELDPEIGAPALARLAATAELGPAIREELRDVVVAGDEDPGDPAVGTAARVPLRVAPTSRSARRHLRTLAPETGRRLLRPAAWQHALTGLLALATIGAGGWGIRQQLTQGRTLEVTSDLSGSAVIRLYESETERVVGEIRGNSGSLPMQADTEYEISVLDRGLYPTEPAPTLTGESARLKLGKDVEEVLCVDDDADLRVVWCPSGSTGEVSIPSWRGRQERVRGATAPARPLWSLGFELRGPAGGDAAAPVRDALLRSSSAPLIVVLDAGADLRQVLVEIFEAEDFGVWTRDVQLIWWSTGQASPALAERFEALLDEAASEPTPVVDGSSKVPAFHSHLRLDTADPNWPQRLVAAMAAAGSEQLDLASLGYRPTVSPWAQGEEGPVLFGNEAGVLPPLIAADDRATALAGNPIEIDILANDTFSGDVALTILPLTTRALEPVYPPVTIPSVDNEVLDIVENYRSGLDPTSPLLPGDFSDLDFPDQDEAADLVRELEDSFGLPFGSEGVERWTVQELIDYVRRNSFGRPRLTYTPAPDERGAVTFSYRIEDAYGSGDTAEVTVSVAPRPDEQPDLREISGMAATSAYMSALALVEIDGCNREILQLLETSRAESNEVEQILAQIDVDYTPFLVLARAHRACGDRAETGRYIDASLENGEPSPRNVIPELQEWLQPSQRLRAAYSESYALVIGASDYQAFEDLSGPREDALRVEEALQERGFDVTRLLDPTRDQILDRLARLAKLPGRDSRIVLYYSGHGMTFTERGLRLSYLVPVDSPRPEDPKAVFDMVSLGELEALAKSSRARQIFFVLDSGVGLTTDLNRRGSAQPTSEAVLAGRRGTRADSWDIRLASFQAAASSAGERDPLSEPASIWMALGEDAILPDTSDFRRNFLRGIQGNADSDQDGIVLTQELCAYMRRLEEPPPSVRDNRAGTSSVQCAREGDGDMGFLSLQASRPARIPSKLQEELDLWDAAVETGAAGYRAYVEEFPLGHFSRLAEWALALASPAQASQE